MDWDEQKPRPAKAVTLGEDLETLSVSELEARLVELAAETNGSAARYRPKKRTRPRPRPFSRPELTRTISASAPGRMPHSVSQFTVSYPFVPLSKSIQPSGFEWLVPLCLTPPC